MNLSGKNTTLQGPGADWALNIQLQNFKITAYICFLSSGSDNFYQEAHRIVWVSLLGKSREQTPKRLEVGCSKSQMSFYHKDQEIFCELKQVGCFLREEWVVRVI